MLKSKGSGNCKVPDFPYQAHAGWGKVGLQLWVHKTPFILILLFMN